MQSKALLTMIALASVALAGCASDAPSGDFTGGSLAATVVGTYNLNANAANNPYPYAGTPLEAVLACTPDALAGPIGQETCSDAYSIITISGVELPSGEYMLYLNGTNGELHVGALEDMNGTLGLTKTYASQDLTGMYSEAQIRYNDMVVAIAAGNGGAFEIAPSLAGATIDASYSGTKLTYTVSDLPTGAGGYTAWLVGTEGDSTELVHMEDFSISAGTGEYEADMNIGDYKEFHIHAAGSSINVLKIIIA